MKRSSLFINREFTSTVFGHALRSVLFTLLAVGLFTACSNDDEPSSFQRKLGSYTVSDLFEADEEPEQYEMTFTKSALGEPHIEITNFGDIMNVPIDASIQGDSLYIPAQTFNGKSMTITISGGGKFSGNSILFDYVIETDDDYYLEHTCEAVKK